MAHMRKKKKWKTITETTERIGILDLNMDSVRCNGN